MRQDRRAQPKAPINENITAREVRLIGVDGEQIGIVSIDEALRVAEEAKLDLVEISADANPPVCRIMDYGKHLFEKKKQAAAAKKNQHQQQIKEIKFRPGTEEGDYQVKLRNSARRRAPLHPAALRSPALHPVFQQHHRRAQVHRPPRWRRVVAAPEGTWPAQ